MFFLKLVSSLLLSKLVYLMLHGNKISGRGASGLRGALQHVNGKLTPGDLLTNNIGYQGAAPLSVACKDVNFEVT